MNKRYSILMPFLISVLLCLTGQTAFASVQVCTSSNNLGKLVADVDSRNSSYGARIPLILIHGVHGTDSTTFANINGSTPQEKNYYQNFINYFYSQGLQDKYQLFRYHYLSDQQPVTNIAAGLQQCLDSFITNRIMPDSSIVILAYSMGGLVARSYMQEHTHTKGIYANQHGGERVEKLITLATPHHGSPGANGASRDALMTDAILWQGVVELASIEYNRHYSFATAISDSAVNRSDLRTDDFAFDNNTVVMNDNTWLTLLNQNTTYDSKIIAYYGYVDLSDSERVNVYSAVLNSSPLYLLPYALQGGNHEKLLVANIIMNEGLSAHFPFNDGMVPEESSKFAGHTIDHRHGPEEQDRLFINYDHLDMIDGVLENNAFPLFDTLKEDLNSIYNSANVSVIIAAEYFIGTDPGEGNGIGMSLSGLTTENVVISIPTSNLTVGLHTFYIRMKNSDGLWGTPRKMMFEVTGNKNIADIEYFIDTDPGEGNGLSMTGLDGYFDQTKEDGIISHNTSNLSLGLHILYVRAKDSEGHWGTPREYKFEVVQPFTTNTVIRASEYFVDTDPGEGNGFALNALDGKFDSYIEAIQGIFDTTYLNYGTHILYVRAKDSLLRWGPVKGMGFSIPQYFDSDGDGYTSDVDCNDNDPLQHPNQIWYQDVDGDGYSTGNMIVQCARPVSYKAALELIATSGDCNDNNPAINPGTTEIINNGIDDDCNPATPVAKASGGGYNYPGAPGFKASMSLNTDASSLGTSRLSYSYPNKRLSLVSTSITGVSATGGTATITGAGKVNNVPGYTFTATVTDGSPDAMGIDIRKPDGTVYYNAASQTASGSTLSVIGK